jgi:hypothetical protein
MSANILELKSDPVITSLTPVVESLRSFASGLVIKSAENYEIAASRLKIIKGALAQIEDARTRITKPINESLRETNAQAKAAAAPFLADEYLIKQAMIKYSDEQDRLRDEQQRKDNEAARKEQERLNEIAARAAAKGQEKKAEQFQERAAQVVAPVAQQAAPKVSGISIPLVWDFEITDSKSVPLEYRDINESRIRKTVTNMQGNTNIPGVRVFQRKRISAGSA